MEVAKSTKVESLIKIQLVKIGVIHNLYDKIKSFEFLKRVLGQLQARYAHVVVVNDIDP